MIRRVAPLLASLLACFCTANAVILFRTGDPSANITAPTNDPAGSGWNYEGSFGSFLGTPIAPHFFISAKHIGWASSAFTYGATNYTVVENFPDPAGDLSIFRVAETIPTFAPLYSRLDELGQRVVDIGRGTQRGAVYPPSGPPQGWLWGNSDGIRRWGENVIESVVPFGTDNELLRAAFDQNGLPDECHLSGGDSGGAAFINDAGTWKLAGINYAVDGHFYADSNGNGLFDAALFDMVGVWVDNDTPPPPYVQVAGPGPVPSGFYPTRISRRLPWICSVVASPTVGREANFLTITYTKLSVAPDVTYLVQQSTDLVSWGPATTTDEVVSTSGSAQVIKSKVNIGTATSLFLRLQITRP